MWLRPKSTLSRGQVAIGGVESAPLCLQLITTPALQRRPRDHQALSALALLFSKFGGKPSLQWQRGLWLKTVTEQGLGTHFWCLHRQHIRSLSL